MKLPLSWIKEFIDIDLAPNQIAKVLTQAGLEVDACEPLPLNFDKVVVAEVLHVEKHPDAESLCIAQVTNGTETYQVICGASNCRQGMKTAMAMLGATLSDESGNTIKIKKTKLRGVESFGMLCSGKELGLDGVESGIMEFSSSMKVGADLAHIFGDYLLEISLTPNLGHCANVIGIARELSAASCKPVKLPTIKAQEKTGSLAQEIASVEVLNKEKCLRYTCRVIKNVKIGPSPAWLQKRLQACDYRPVNNVVDITNYVLLEMGQPLHAFDYDKIDAGSIIVRNATENEIFATLDGKEHTLLSQDLMICDASKPIAIAGVMGGANTEVSEETRNILLESAYFQPASIRRTSKRLGLQTEASKRFERGCDPNSVIKALDRAAMLLHEMAGGEIAEGILEVKQEGSFDKTVTVRLSRINQLLGTHLSLSEVEMIFHRLDMGYAWDGQNLFTVKPPTYRADINQEVDLIEEVARIYGFDNIPKRTPSYVSSLLPHAPIYLFENEIRQRLLAEGLQEFLTCDLIGPGLLNISQENFLQDETLVKVLNPNSIEQSILRTSLLPGLLQVVKYNYDREVHDINGFEIGRVHFKKKEQYIEQSVAAIILTGKMRPDHWDVKPATCDFYDLKGMVETLLNELHIGSYSFKNNKLKTFHPGRQASIYIDSLEIGSLGEIHPEIQRKLDVPQKILFAEIDLHDIFKVRPTEMKMKEIPIFPNSTRDLTITLDEHIPIQEIFDIIYSIPSRLLESVTLTDVYLSDKIGKGKKNVTFHFVYRDKKKTVAQETVEAEHARIISQIETRIRR